MFNRRPRPKKKITLRDVATHAGVSPKTVSNVINNWPYVTDETRAKVERSISALDYRPSGVASSLRTGRTNTIGVMIPDITNPFFGQVIRGCEDVLYTTGYSIFLCNTGENSTKERRYLDMLVNRGVDGLLMFGSRSNAEVLTAVVHDGIPVVAEDSPAQNGNTTVIEIDNIGGAQRAVEHLITLGHRRIAHLGGPVQRLAADHRLQGYRQALENAGIPYEETLVLRCAPTIRGGFQSSLALLPSKKPTALFCYNDLMAIGAMVVCHQLDLNIPDDIAIVGFDDIAIASLVEPALTTVRVRQYDMGRLASELLLERLSGKEKPQTIVQFPVELMIRNSCGASGLSRTQLNQRLEHLFSSELADLNDRAIEK
jgi:LacI family transcriptional regulator